MTQLGAEYHNGTWILNFRLVILQMYTRNFTESSKINWFQSIFTSKAYDDVYRCNANILSHDEVLFNM